MKRGFSWEDNRFWLRPVLIIVVVILYWAFVYYPYHYSNYTPISFVVVGAVLFFLGIYGFFVKKDVKFKDLKYMYYVVLALAIISEVLIQVALGKHGLLPGIDITWAWIAQKAGMIVVDLVIIISLPIYLILLAGTYKILGKDYVYFWGMICLAWIVSNIRLLVNFVLK